MEEQYFLVRRLGLGRGVHGLVVVAYSSDRGISLRWDEVVEKQEVGLQIS